MPRTATDAPTGISALVGGRVQAVGFRWFVCQTAHRLGLSGWVANLPDGSVQVVASGSAAAVGELTAALHLGPPGARVDQVTLGPVNPGQTLPDPFQIK